jgi:hypothetical protein
MSVSYELAWLVVGVWTDGAFLTARAYAIMPFVWSIGTIIGPGKLSSPLNLSLLYSS